jgi:hypothetical protein
MPGAPIEAVSRMNPSAMIRMVSAHVCQPNAIIRPTKVRFAASSSIWKGCGSNLRANATMSSFVTVTPPSILVEPGAKSSKCRRGGIGGPACAALVR